jgi:magnesium transporter
VVITFEEYPGDPFEPVRERLRNGRGKLRHCGTDYLAYSLLDALIDQYFVLAEALDERLERLDDEVFASGSRGDVGPHIHRLKTDLLSFRRAVWPLKEVLAALRRGEFALIHGETQPYLRDCHDHIVHMLDMIENYREITTGLMDAYLSSINNRLNEIMKVLTMIATIFIPLSFVAGIYGMNFNPDASPFNMPELGWYWGYPFALGIMAVIAAGLLWFFQRKGWLRRRKRRQQRKARARGF